MKSHSVCWQIPRALISLALVAWVMVMEPAVSNGAFPGTNGRLACTSTRDGNFEIYTYNPDGSDPRRLTVDPATDFEATWSPDGTRIAFASTRSGDEEIWSMYQDGSGLRRLTDTPGDDRPGTYTPDGTKIAFHSARFAAEMPPGPVLNALEIMIMDADGSNPIRLTTNNFQDSFAHVSPDGTKIAFTTNRDTDFEVYTMNLDGTNPTRITTSPGEDAHASWSPDGSQLVFHSRRAPHGLLQLEIYRMNADGSGNAVRLTTDAEPFDAFPVWSPDGTKIGWSRGLSNIETFTMDALDGSTKTNISNAAGTDFRCEWGRRLACTVTGAGLIQGTDGDDVICGSAGNDQIMGGNGNDVIYAGAGDDQVTAGSGDDIVFAEHGNDVLSGDDGDDVLFGDQGDDQVLGSSGDDVVSGSEGTDQVAGDGGDDECYGEAVTGCP